MVVDRLAWPHPSPLLHLCATLADPSVVSTGGCLPVVSAHAAWGLAGKWVRLADERTLESGCGQGGRWE